MAKGMNGKPGRLSTGEIEKFDIHLFSVENDLSNAF
jgi:hypothetical protein